MQDFTTSCLQKYKCGDIDPNSKNISASQGPYVKLQVKGGVAGSVITVGNKGCPGCDPRHSSIIKGFEYGSTNGFRVNITIHDLGGGTFDTLVKSMSTDSTKFNDDYSLRVEWGWIECPCSTVCSTRKSIAVCFLVSSITASMDAGKIVYEIEGTDLWKGIMQGAAYEVEGDDSAGKPLKQAIRDMFAKGPQPIITDIQYKRRNGDASTGDWGFFRYGKDGPESKWPANQRTKIAVALDWLKSYRSDQDRGITKFTWNVNGSCEPSIIFWEDNTGHIPKIAKGCIRTYIVNGGKDSSVVSFQPKFKWDMTHRAGGGGEGSAETSDQTKGDNSLTPSATGDGEKGQGNQMGGGALMQETNQNGSQQADAQRNIKINLNNNTPKIAPVEADLTVHGDPDLVATLQVYQTWVSIIVVNPFHLTGGSARDCPDWTVKPPCNTMMSNNCWMIKGINHSIKEGSYLTTLKIELPAPGATTPTGQPLGCGGPVIN
jgi:hypothetical protein